MFDGLYEPIQINQTIIKNRLVVSAMVTGYNNIDGTITERYMRYHEEKAKGGWGLIITEDYGITPTAKASARVPGMYDDNFIAANQIFTERIHRAGGKIFAQIYHAGRVANPAVTGEQPVAPSALRDETKTVMPRELTIAEIEMLVEQFAQAALRVKKSGFDGVELHGASGYLLGQFLSPYSNKRSDIYGGSLVGRAKFAIDVVKRIRELVGEAFPISYRISSDEYVEGGLTIEEAKTVAQLLEQAGVDIMHCSQGIFATRPIITPPYAIPAASFVKNAAAIKAAVHIPVIAVGRINTPYLANAIICSGQADMVTMARASLADPYLPEKVRTGNVEDIRLCIGCVQGCQGGNARGTGVRCLVNPMTGREGEYQIIPVEAPKRIIVAGGGVAGCEVAIMAARRGHQVALYEKESRLGGQWRIACIPSGKADFASFLLRQQHQLQQYGVQVHMGTALTAQQLSVEQADILIDATGSKPFVPSIPGIQREHVVFAAELLSGQKPLKKRIAVLGGGLVGAETAEWAAMQGSQVFLIEMQAEIAKEAVANPRLLLLRSLQKKGVVIYTNTVVQGIGDKNLLLKRGDCQDTISLCDIEEVVVATGSKPLGLSEEVIKDFNGQVLKIGDAAGIQDGYLNIQTAFELGLQI